MAIPCTRVVLTKWMTYRGQPEEFSNGYCWANAGPPASDLVSWNALRDLLLAQEKTVFTAAVAFKEIYGWNDANPQVAHAYYYAWPTASQPTGTFVAPASSNHAAGDQAAVVQWPATLKSSRGKPVHFRKYFHRPFMSIADPDALETSYLAALNAFASSTSNVWNLAGALCNQFGGKAYGPTANHAAGPGSALPYVTTRTLRRRGERPLSPAKISSAIEQAVSRALASQSPTTI